MALRVGFAVKNENARPPKSSKGFEWPTRPTDEQKAIFRKVFTQLLLARGDDHRTFATTFLGESKTGPGYIVPRSPNTIRDWIDGKTFPTEARARQLAACLKIPMERLLTDNADPFVPMPLLRPGRATSARKHKANGHGGNGHGGPPVVSPAPAGAPLAAPAMTAPPKGAKPITVKVETIPGASDWCNVVVSGSIPLDVGLGLIAFIDRGTHKARK
jgi:hypothetical protein